MRYLELGTICALVAIVFALILRAIPQQPQSTFFEFDTSKTETGRWIMFNPNDLAAKPSAKTMIVQNAEQIEGLNAFVFDQEPPQLKTLINTGWVIQKELVHHAFMGSAGPAKCYKSISPLQEIDCAPVTPTPTPNPNPGPVPNPTPGPTPTPVEPDKSWGRARVYAKAALETGIKTENVKVCVIDTGIDEQHPNNGDVIGKIGFAGAVQDRAGHGTHCAGTVSGRGGVGVSRAKLLICKGLSDSGSGSSSTLAQCLNWCGQQGAHIVSNSWGSPQQDPMINAAIKALTAKGIAVVVANGNDSRGTLNWPAQLSINDPLVFGIAASDQSDRKASFSTYGPGTKYIAPGVAIVSNFPGGGTRPMDGTSMATPHVAGLLAFCKAKNIPFQNCLKTDNLSLPQDQQGAGLPRADLTIL